MGNTLQLIISFLGGGILVAVMNWARTSRSERTARKHEFLKDQIAKLYGPLYFFVGLNEALFGLNDKFHKAYNEHYVNEKWSTDPRTTEGLKKEIRTTIDIANHYVRLVRDNNAKVVDLLRENYAYIDPGDAEVFQQFIVDYLRNEREFKQELPLATPMAIYFTVGEISYSRKEFMELVATRFAEKTSAVKSIH